MSAQARLKNEFTEDEKYRYLMTLLICLWFSDCLALTQRRSVQKANDVLSKNLDTKSRRFSYLFLPCIQYGFRNNGFQVTNNLNMIMHLLDMIFAFMVIYMPYIINTLFVFCRLLRVKVTNDRLLM